MKKWVLRLIISTAMIIAMAGFCFACRTVGMFDKPTVTTQSLNKFGNMVNASVLLFDDFGHASGVFISDNVILTAAHCLENKTTISIEMSDGTILDSNDFYIDEKIDVGFIYVDAEELHIAKMSDIPPEVGDTVFHVGAPYHVDFKFSLAGGIVSFMDRGSPIPKWRNLIQTDIDGGTGNSGGPLYNSGGILIGVYVGQSYRGGLSISFYIPVDQIKVVLEEYNAQ